MARLNWEDQDFGQVRAKDNPYEFVIWSDSSRKNPAELRIIRKENAGGIIVPLQDFSVCARDVRAAKKLAESLNKVLRKAREYNGYINL
jgi:hypothetical protein